jgi:hypothetical protein
MHFPSTPYGIGPRPTSARHPWKALSVTDNVRPRQRGVALYLYGRQEQSWVVQRPDQNNRQAVRWIEIENS